MEAQESASTKLRSRASSSDSETPSRASRTRRPESPAKSVPAKRRSSRRTGRQSDAASDDDNASVGSANAMDLITEDEAERHVDVEEIAAPLPPIKEESKFEEKSAPAEPQMQPDAIFVAGKLESLQKMFLRSRVFVENLRDSKTTAKLRIGLSMASSMFQACRVLGYVMVALLSVMMYAAITQPSMPQTFIVENQQPGPAFAVNESRFKEIADLIFDQRLTSLMLEQDSKIQSVMLAINSAVETQVTAELHRTSGQKASEDKHTDAGKKVEDLESALQSLRESLTRNDPNPGSSSDSSVSQEVLQGLRTQIHSLQEQIQALTNSGASKAAELQAAAQPVAEKSITLLEKKLAFESRSREALEDHLKSVNQKLEGLLPVGTTEHFLAQLKSVDAELHLEELVRKTVNTAVSVLASSAGSANGASSPPAAIPADYDIEKQVKMYVSSVVPLQLETKVRALLEDYSADRIGRSDFALSTVGSRIMSAPRKYFATRAVAALPEAPSVGQRLRYYTTVLGSVLRVAYFWFSEGLSAVLELLGVREHPATLMITADKSPGKCFMFAGSSANVTIKLFESMIATHFSIDHLSHKAAVTVTTAPRHLKVWGLLSDPRSAGVLLAEHVYDIGGPSVQTFPVKSTEAASKVPHRYIRVEFLSNHGHPTYTCVYRFRAHGIKHDPSAPRTVVPS